MDSIIPVIAALAAGIAVTCTLLFIFDLLQRVELDARQSATPEELRRLPLMIKLFIPLAPNFRSVLNLPAFRNMHKSTADLIMQAGLDQIVTAEQFLAARAALALIGGGVARREAASVADMRGYRLYRRRLFGQARAWFRAAVSIDSSFEPGLYNGARCATLLGDLSEARSLLHRLHRLATPLARARIALSLTDADLAPLRAAEQR